VQHQQIQAHISELTGLNFVMSTPYEFVSVVNGHLNILNFERTIGYLIDFALTIPDTSKFSSEEIFVACCLVACEQQPLNNLANVLLHYFEPSLENGCQLKELIRDDLLQCLDNEA
jgi:hypothetical protein